MVGWRSVAGPSLTSHERGSDHRESQQGPLSRSLPLDAGCYRGTTTILWRILTCELGKLQSWREDLGNLPTLRMRDLGTGDEHGPTRFNATLTHLPPIFTPF